jgi:hypothetical protein
MNCATRWQIIDVEFAYSFFTDSEERRDYFVEAIELLGHEARVLEVKDANHNN